MTRAVEADLDAVVDQPLGMHALADAGLVQEVGHALLDDACPDAAQHIIAAALLQDDVVDALAVEKLAQEQARRARADDPDLGAHGVRSLGGLSSVVDQKFA